MHETLDASRGCRATTRARWQRGARVQHQRSRTRCERRWPLRRLALCSRQQQAAAAPRGRLPKQQSTYGERHPAQQIAADTRPLRQAAAVHSALTRRTTPPRASRRATETQTVAARASMHAQPPIATEQCAALGPVGKGPVGRACSSRRVHAPLPRHAPPRAPSTSRTRGGAGCEQGHSTRHGWPRART